MQDSNSPSTLDELKVLLEKRTRQLETLDSQRQCLNKEIQSLVIVIGLVRDDDASERAEEAYQAFLAPNLPITLKDRVVALLQTPGVGQMTTIQIKEAVSEVRPVSRATVHATLRRLAHDGVVNQIHRQGQHALWTCEQIG